jgi:hypothetical protein
VERHDLLLLPNTIRVIKSRRMKWLGHVARCGGGELHVKFWWETPRKKYNFEVGRPSRMWVGNTGMDIK